MKDVKRNVPKKGDRVRVRMNLNKGLIVVKAASGPNYGKMLYMTDEVVKVSDPEFRVMDGSYERVVNEGQRDLCAYVVGTYEGHSSEEKNPNVFYNPFRQKHFHFRDSTPVKGKVEGEELFFWAEDGKGRMKLTTDQTENECD
jgi:hypothetical protein